MSATAMTWALYQRLPPGQKLVLLALGDRANHEGVCWPGLHDLSEVSGLSHRSVLRALEKLTDAGLVEKINRRGQSGRYTSNLYVLHFEAGRPISAIGGDLQRRAERFARMPRPCGQAVDNSPKAVDKSVHNSIHHVTNWHMVPAVLEVEQVPDSEAEIGNRNISPCDTVSPLLEPVIKNQSPVDHPSLSANGVRMGKKSYKERASMPANTQKARSPKQANPDVSAATTAALTKERPSRAARLPRARDRAQEVRQDVQAPPTQPEATDKATALVKLRAAKAVLMS